MPVAAETKQWKDNASQNHALTQNVRQHNDTPKNHVPPMKTGDHRVIIRNVSLPVVIVGLNKAGTSSIRDYFRCGGFKTSHYFCNDGDQNPSCGSIIKGNIQRGDPPFAEMNWEVYSEINDHKICYYPQMQALEELHRHYANATFILNLRNTTQWVDSVKAWGHGPEALWKKIIKCDLPGLPVGKGSTDFELASWFKTHTKRVREFVSNHASHKLVEVKIDSKDAGEVMEEHFGISAKLCWGETNKRRGGKGGKHAEDNRFIRIPLIAHSRRKIDWHQIELPDFYPLNGTPAFLGIGAQKAGTTAFFKICFNHPNITRPKWKELHFFAGRNMPPPDKDTNSIIQMYQLLFENATYNCPTCKITGEVTPQYMRFPHTAIPMIKKVCPWVKLVVVLREPIARAISSFKMMKNILQRRNVYTNVSLEELVNEDFRKMAKSGLLKNWTEEKGWVEFDSFAGSIEEERSFLNLEKIELSQGFSDHVGIITSGLIQRGLYELQLRHWIRAFGMKNILIINTDRDSVGPDVCKRFHNFMGLEEIVGLSQENTYIKNLDSNSISPALRTKLENFFSPYNRRLGSLLGGEWTENIWKY